MHSITRIHMAKISLQFNAHNSHNSDDAPNALDALIKQCCASRLVFFFLFYYHADGKLTALTAFKRRSLK